MDGGESLLTFVIGILFVICFLVCGAEATITALVPIGVFWCGILAVSGLLRSKSAPSAGAGALKWRSPKGQYQ